MKICLLNPPYRKKYFSTEMLGVPLPCLAYLAGAMRGSIHNVDLIDAKLENLTIEEVKERIERLRPDILGLSVVTTDMPVSRKIAKHFKTIVKNGTLIVGGVHPSALPNEVLENETNFDIAVLGEGEMVLPALVEALDAGQDLAGVDGIVYRQNGRIVFNPPGQIAQRLDDYPMPAWDKLPKGRMYYIQISRGCPGQCAFCYNMFGKQIRVCSPERIVAEIEMIIAHADPEEFFFSAATFGLPKRHAHQLMDLLISSGLNRKIKWRAATRPDIHDRAFFEKMRVAGCYWVGFGIESGDNSVLQISGKHTQLDRIKTSIDDAKQVGLLTVGFFIIGHPFETRQSALRTSDFAVMLNPSLVTIGIMTPWPGTRVYEMALQGDGGYQLSSKQEIEGQHKHFGKRAMLFTNMSLSFIQWVRIRTYLLLYIKNRRYRDGLRFVRSYFADGVALLMDIGRELVWERLK